MSHLETNIFPITNLRDLKTSYLVYRIRGLTIDQEEYDHNVQTLTYRLSSLLLAPVTVIIQDSQPYLVVPEGVRAPPSPFQLVRITVHFDSTEKTVLLDYENPTAETEPICLRFLQSYIENTLRRDPRFWQPSAGQPIFEREPTQVKDGINVYRGYAFRVVRTDEGKFGVCVDVTFRYVSSTPLPVGLSRDDFRRFKGTRCIYHFGLDWYEISPQEYTGLSVKEQLIGDRAAKPIPLYDYIMQKARRPFPTDVANLSPESMAVRYFTLRGEARHAAVALCYPVYDTSDHRIQSLHRETILAPQKRHQLIHTFVKEILKEIQTDKMKVRVSPTSLSAPKNLILPPDLAFGKDTILSVRGTKGAVGVSLNQLGRERLSSLYNPNIGPHVKKPLDQQYFVIPQSVLDSYGPAFLDDLKKEVNALYPQEIPYEPAIIPYDDRISKTFATQGRAILEAIDTARLKPGYGIVMIHDIERRMRQQDQLATMLMHQLRKRDLYMSIIHTTVSSQSYRLTQKGHDGPVYQVVDERKGKLSGYLRNVALNKVLLTNECWPFVLATPLNADLTIAIDVKNHTACFTFMGKSGPDIHTEITISSEKEKLDRAHVKKVVIKVLRDDPMIAMKGIRAVVIQRDGRIYNSEMKGVKEAIDSLRREGILPSVQTINFVEIHKKSLIPFRVFDVDGRPGEREFIQNPQIGSYIILNSHDGYICSTGREFRHPGTTKPLHIKYIEGAIPLKGILEDIYSLTSLALTRPEDCSRLPFTLRLTDIRLSEHAGGYDEDALAFGEEESEETESSPEKEEANDHE